MRKFIAYISLLSALVVSPPALAQQAEDEVRVLEEVIVTATKREAAITDIPLAVTAISGDELEAQAAVGFADYLKSVPGVQFNPGPSIYQQSISFRGVTDGSGSFLTQTPVAIYLDETPITVSQGGFNFNYSVYDIDQVTVIKGPHSTLYGAGSLGGTLKFVTSEPDLNEHRVRLLGTLESTEHGDMSFLAKASWSGPVVEDVFALGLTAYYSDRGGYIDDPSRGLTDINESEATGGRIVGRLQPSDRLSIVGTVYFQENDMSNQDIHSPELFGDLNSRPLVIDQPQTDELTLASLVIKYDFDASQLVSASSYFDREGSTTGDFSNSFLNLGIPGAIVPSFITTPADFFSQEIRLVSTGDSRFQWSIGGFYSDENYDEFASVPHSVVGELFGGDFFYQWETLAAFGELGYLFENNFELTVGARWTDYEFATQQFLEGLFFMGLPNLDTGFAETDVSPRAALSYHADWGTAYVQVAKGFRLGQANVPILVLPGETFPDTFESDSLWNYEIGAKTEWLDRRMTLNVAAYYIDWSDIQSTLTAGTGFLFIDNTGDAEIFGAEAEFDTLLSDSWRLSFGFALNQAELATDVPTVAPKGTDIPGVPDFTFNTALQYDFSLFGGDSYARLDYLHYGEYDDTFSTAQAPSLKNGDYDKLDLRLGWQGDHIDVTIFATNLTDERPVLVRSFSNGPEATTLRPRTVGVSVGYRY